jgi:Fic family protein
LRADDTPLRFEDGETVFGSIEGPSPLESEAFLKKIMAWLGKVLEDPEIHPLLAIAVLTAVLYQLAPFAAENARTIRQLVTILMFRMGYTYAPYALLEAPRGSAGLELFTRVLALKEGIEAGAPDWPGWIEYFLGILTARKNELSSRLEKDKSQLADMPELSRKILKLFDKQERLGMKEIERQTKGARATLKLRLGELVEGGYLKRHGQARSTWYARL